MKCILCFNYGIEYHYFIIINNILIINDIHLQLNKYVFINYVISVAFIFVNPYSSSRVSYFILFCQFWKTEVLNETDHMVSEIEALLRSKGVLEKSLGETENPLHIAQVIRNPTPSHVLYLYIQSIHLNIPIDIYIYIFDLNNNLFA